MSLFSILIMSDVRTICRTVPGLTKEQLELCYRANDVTTAAIDGLELAVKECQLQVNGFFLNTMKTIENNFKFTVSVASVELFFLEFEEKESSHVKSFEKG